MIRHEVIDIDLTTVLATIDQETDDNGFASGALVGSGAQVTLSEVGSGTLRLHRDHPALDQISDGVVIRSLAWNIDTEAWVPCGAFVARRKRDVIVPTGRDAPVVEWSGPGVSSLLDDMPIMPRQAIPMDKLRRWDWTHPAFPVTDWDDPDVRSIIGDPATPPDAMGSQPHAHPNPLTSWIWGTAAGPSGDPAGTCIFHAQFTTSSPEDIIILPAADDVYAVALDNAVVMTRDDETATAAVNADYRLIHRLPAGTHTIRALVRNIDRPSLDFNVGMFAVAVARFIIQDLLIVGDRLFYDWIVTTSSSGWKVLAYPETMPGFTATEILEEGIGDAHSAGFVPYYAGSFSGAVGSDSGGMPVAPGETIAVGSSVLDLARQLAGRGWCEWSEGLTLPLTFDVVAERGEAVSVDLDAAVNVTELVDLIDSTAAVDALLVEWSGGHVIVGDPGRCGSFRTSATTEADAIAAGEAELARQIAERTVTVAWDASTPATTPHMAFNLGDTIPAPGGLGSLRVRAITWRLEDDRIAWTVTLGSLQKEYAERLGRLARRLTPGALSGRSETVAPPASFQPAAGTLRTEPITIAVDGDTAAVVGNHSGPKSLSAPGVICRAVMRCRDAAPSTGSTTVQLYIAGTASLWEFELPAGETVATFPGLVIYGDPSIPFHIETISSGGHLGPTLDLTASLMP